MALLGSLEFQHEPRFYFNFEAGPAWSATVSRMR